MVRNWFVLLCTLQMLNIMSFLLYALYAVQIFAVIMMVSCMNPIHSVVFFILVFASSSLIFIFLHAEFLGLVFLMVYVGAIAVLFIFVVMMLNVKKLERDNTTYLLIGGLIFVCFSMQMIYILLCSYTIYSPSNVFFCNALMYDLLVNSDEFVTKYNVQLIGILVFSEYPILLFVSGTTLLVSLIGSVYLTNTKTGYSLRRQDNTFSRTNYIYNIHVY